jgi:hypothetical protein
MIIRILGEGRFEVPASAVEAIGELYGQLVDAVRAHDEAAFEPALSALLTEVRLQGDPMESSRLGVFHALFPGKDATIQDAQVLLGMIARLRAGLVPG